MIGISLDGVDSHKAFAEKLKLPYSILSDEGGKVAKRYGVYIDKYGGVAARSVFLVDEKGRIAYADREYSVKDDADYEALLKAAKGEKAAPGGERKGGGVR